MINGTSFNRKCYALSGLSSSLAVLSRGVAPG